MAVSVVPKYTMSIHTATFSRTFLKVKAMPPQMIKELTCDESQYIRDTAYMDSYLVQHVLNELDLVRDLSSSQNSQERTLRVLEGFGEVLKLFLHEESGSLLWEVNSNH